MPPPHYSNSAQTSLASGVSEIRFHGCCVEMHS